MHPNVVLQLLALNQSFYTQRAIPFAQSRVQPQPGFHQLLAYLPPSCKRWLDVGCGNGRWGQFLYKQQRLTDYTGIDFSAALLAQAQIVMPDSEFWQRDISQPNCLKGLAQFEGIACLAALQHIPGHNNRRRLVQEMASHLSSKGRLLLSTWQFMDSQRQRRKIVPWSEVGLKGADVEENDYLLTWRRGGLSYRYVCLIDHAETAVLVQSANLQIVHQFRSDGREGDLSLYTICS